MASLFVNTRGDLRVLDPGAGVGSLTAAFAERLCTAAVGPWTVDFVCYEIDLVLCGYLRRTLREVEGRCKGKRVDVSSSVLQDDFILGHKAGQQPDMFDDVEDDDEGFTHVILNPPLPSTIRTILRGRSTARTPVIRSATKRHE